MPLKDKKDGKKYSKVLRRSVSILESINPQSKFKIRILAQTINTDASYKEFYLSRTEKQMSVSRISAYLRYLIELNTLFEKNDEPSFYKLNITKPNDDESWVHKLSDLALKHLSEVTDLSPSEFLGKLETIINNSFKNKQIPTIRNIADRFDVEAGRKQEVFRWSMYIFLDYPNCPFKVYYYPYILKKK